MKLKLSSALCFLVLLSQAEARGKRPAPPSPRRAPAAKGSAANPLTSTQKRTIRDAENYMKGQPYAKTPSDSNLNSKQKRTVRDAEAYMATQPVRTPMDPAKKAQMMQDTKAMPAMGSDRETGKDKKPLLQTSPK